MEKRFSEMSEYELRNEIAKLKEKSKKAEQLGMLNKVAVYERRALVAEAYMLDPEQFLPGERYEIDPYTSFTISYMNGYFAWGYRNDDTTLEGIPISLLKRKLH